MKPNQYHLFGASVTGILLIILGLILFGCTEEPVQPLTDGIRCVSQSDTIEQNYTVTIVFGTTVQSNGLLDPDTSIIVTEFGQLPREIELPGLTGTCQLIATDEVGDFVPCRFCIIKDGTLIKDVCCNGCTLVFEL